ncbi:right-handed parallel beta-helix repeat-containing protein [Nonomuraea wenchangensis]|uniref:right-handed parallel beta-helix repeat-containing protein n=1 Tax=Nonomuraea wenchangensis TaxID=568860 RepID=UPI00371B53AB
MSLLRKLSVTVLLALACLLPAAPALAHEERPVSFPDGTGSVPVYRTTGPELLVCKTDRADFDKRVATFPAALKEQNLRLFERCQKDGFRHLQEAVDQVKGPGYNIKILPGLYQEEPSLPEPTGACANLPARRSSFGYQILSFEQQQKCPHNQNLVAILGIKDLQIEGTGAAPRDVIVDAQYKKLNAIRADMTNGIYFRNFTAQRTTFNSLYILASDGFVIDRMLTRWNDEYGFLTFASDHGLYTDCESHGNGDSGIYPGSASDINAGRSHDVPRYSIEIRGCKSYQNMVGYSGTAGNSVWAHDNEFFDNMAGASMDSLFPDHPGLPQNHAKFEKNKIYNNNKNYYNHVRDGTCAKPAGQRGYESGVVCPQIGVAPGTGILTAGGNFNVYRDNWIYGHDRTAFMLLWAPAFLRGEEALDKQADTSHDNFYGGNRLGVAPDGSVRPNATDVIWDGQGSRNCWDTQAPTSPYVVPGCGGKPGELAGAGSHRLVGEPAKLAHSLVCAEYNVTERRLPAGCDWFGSSGLARVEVQVTLGTSVFIGLIVALLWWRRLRTAPAAAASGASADAAAAPRAGRLGAVSAVLALAGLALDVAGAAYDYTLLPAAALLLLGGGLTGMGLALRREYRFFGGATIVLGALTLLDAVDKSLLLIPWLPLSPAWLRGLFAIVWVLWAVVRLAPRPRTTPVPESTSPAEAPA